MRETIKRGMWAGSPRYNGGDSALGERKVYFAHVCGFAAIRDAITDEILYHLSERRTPEAHLASAEKIARKFGWELV